MDRALERADRGHDRRVKIGEGPGDDARGERRRVHLVLRVEDHRDVERTQLLLRRRLTAQHREEVLGVGERRIRWNRVQALPDSVVPGDDRR